MSTVAELTGQCRAQPERRPRGQAPRARKGISPLAVAIALLLLGAAIVAVVVSVHGPQNRYQQAARAASTTQTPPARSLTRTVTPPAAADHPTPAKTHPRSPDRKIDPTRTHLADRTGNEHPAALPGPKPNRTTPAAPAPRRAPVPERIPSSNRPEPVGTENTIIDDGVDPAQTRTGEKPHRPALPPRRHGESTPSHDPGEGRPLGLLPRL